MLAVIIAAALTPNLGAAAAPSAVQPASNYNQSPSSSGLSGLDYVAIAVVVLAVAVLIAYVFLRRRRPPSAAPSVQPWQGGPAPGAAPPPAAPPPPPPPAAIPAYLETPEDVSQAPPPIPAAKGAATGAAAGAAAGAASAEAEPDIDSLMAELDKISGEILKRAPKKGAGPPSSSTGENPPK